MISEEYQRFRSGFEAAMDPDFHRIEDLDAKVQSGGALLWSSDKAAILAEVHRHPGALVLHGIVAAGDLDEIVNELIPQAEFWARAAGCTHTEIESRAGWQKALKGAGYEVQQVKLRKAL